MMRDVPEEKRTACFICEAAFIDQDGQTHCFEGKTSGKITQKLEAPLKEGLPLSSCFKPEGFEKVYAALSLPEKNLISHRGKAMMQVEKFLSLHAEN